MAFTFDKILKEMAEKKRSLPKVLGNIAVNHFKDNFRKGGFVDNTLDPWEKRKTKNSSDRRNRAPRAILIDTGHLRRAITVMVADFSQIRIGAPNVDYGSFHNEGGGKLPKRQFIGKSGALNKKLSTRIQTEIKDILK
jgi:phage gpG-like protein